MSRTFLDLSDRPDVASACASVLPMRKSARENTRRIAKARLALGRAINPCRLRSEGFSLASLTPIFQTGEQDRPAANRRAMPSTTGRELFSLSGNRCFSGSIYKSNLRIPPHTRQHLTRPNRASYYPALSPSHPDQRARPSLSLGVKASSMAATSVRISVFPHAQLGSCPTNLSVRHLLRHTRTRRLA